MMKYFKLIFVAFMVTLFAGCSKSPSLCEQVAKQYLQEDEHLLLVDYSKGNREDYTCSGLVKVSDGNEYYRHVNFLADVETFENGTWRATNIVANMDPNFKEPLPPFNEKNVLKDAKEFMPESEHAKCLPIMQGILEGKNKPSNLTGCHMGRRNAQYLWDYWKNNPVEAMSSAEACPEMAMEAIHLIGLNNNANVPKVERDKVRTKDFVFNNGVGRFKVMIDRSATPEFYNTEDGHCQVIFSASWKGDRYLKGCPGDDLSRYNHSKWIVANGTVEIEFRYKTLGGYESVLDVPSIKYVESKVGNYTVAEGMYDQPYASLTEEQLKLYCFND